MKRNFYYAVMIIIIFSVGSVYAQTETSKYDNGQLEFSIQYDSEGNEHGEWKYYFENGKVEMIENYNHGWPSGLWASYFENGQLETQGYYNNEGYENGIWEAYFENGKLNYKGEYLNGLPIKDWKIYNDDGSLEASLSFSDKGKPTGEFIANHKNKNPKVTGYFDNMGLKTGTWKTYYSSGAIKYELIYENNLVSEIKSAFDDEGIALVYTKMNDGPLKGLWLDAEEDGIDEIDYHAVFYVINFSK